MTTLKLLSAVLLSSVAVSATAHAAVVKSGDERSFSAFDPLTLRDRPLDDFIATAGAVDIRDRSDFEDNHADDIADAVFFAPGVHVNALDIQEPRLSIRGFAIGNGQHRSNVRTLRDGAPLTDVHGTTNNTEIDLYSTQELRIVRGVANLREGGGNLGGAVNLISRTGRTTPSGLAGRVDGGASIDGKPGGQAHLRLAGASANVDYYAGLTGVYDIGWRDNNRRTSQQFHGNIGWNLRDNLTTRFHVDVANSKTELAGGLTLAQVEESQQQPTPPITLGPLFPGGPIINLVDGARTDDFARDIREGRIANTTGFSVFGHDVEVGGHYTRRDIESPQIDFVGFLDEQGSEWGARLEVERSMRFLGGEALYRIGGDWTDGSQTSDRSENNNGERGDLNSSTDQKSKVINAFVEGVYKPLERLVVDAGAKFIKVDRQLTDLSDDDVDTSDFTGVAARGGVRFEISEAMQVYVSASRAYEPPTMAELTSGDPTDLNGLDEQDSFTLEGGVRGKIGDWIGFNVAYYDTDAENEIINIADPSSFVNGAVYANAANTTHKGVEAGVDLALFPNTMRQRGAALTLRNTYQYADHRFVDGGDVGDVDGNRIGGLPVHQYRGEVRYDVQNAWFIAANLQLSRGAYFADHENTVGVPNDPIVGFSAGYRLSDQVEVFASGENILDSGYIAGVTPVTTFDPDADRIFTPGARASVYGGLKYRF